MIKRRFYRQDHGDKDDVSDSSSSSSSSDSEVEAQSSADESGDEVEHDELSDRLKLQVPSPSSSSGNESEESSADELDAADSLDKKEKIGMVKVLAKDVSIPDDVGKWILKSKSVFKCRLCPKVVCLKEETLQIHLKSNRHARAEKQLSKGKLKIMLNSDGEEEVMEEEGETHAERHARILALALEQEKPKKKVKGRQRQRSRLKRKVSVIRSYIKCQIQNKRKHQIKRRKRSEAVQLQENKSCCIIIQDTEVDSKLPNHMKNEAPTAATTEYNSHIWSRLTLLNELCEG